MISVHDLRRVPTDTAAAWAEMIAASMRQQDIDEVRASSAQAPRDALMESLALSTHAYCVESHNLGPVAMFGAAPHPLPGVGIVWMLGTDGIRAESYSIARATKRYFDELNDAYWMLWNFIDARNAVSLRWLRWGGFKLCAEHPNHGPEGRPFFTFARTTVDV